MGFPARFGIFAGFFLSTFMKHEKSKKFQNPEFLEFQPEFYVVHAEFLQSLCSKVTLKFRKPEFWREK